MKKYIVIPKNISVREYDIRTPKGNKARKQRVLEQGKELVFVEEFLSTNPMRHGMYTRLLDEKDGYTYIVYSEKLRPEKVTMNSGVKSWYIRTYPTDELGVEINDITFQDVFYRLDTRKDIYELLGVGDSIVRERVFTKLAELMGCDYSYIYDQWLHSSRG